MKPILPPSVGDMLLSIIQFSLLHEFVEKERILIGKETLKHSSIKQCDANAATDTHQVTVEGSWRLALKKTPAQQDCNSPFSPTTVLTKVAALATLAESETSS